MRHPKIFFHFAKTAMLSPEACENVAMRQTISVKIHENLWNFITMERTRVQLIFENENVF